MPQHASDACAQALAAQSLAISEFPEKFLEMKKSLT
jgi:hypothetical protein